MVKDIKQRPINLFRAPDHGAEDLPQNSGTIAERFGREDELVDYFADLREEVTEMLIETGLIEIEGEIYE